jgi:hypothetical protein
VNRRPNNLRARVENLERHRRPKGSRFFMLWGSDEIELTDALSKAKASGDVGIGDKFCCHVWALSTQPPPPRWVSFHEMSDKEWAIFAEGADKDKNADNSLRRFSDAEISLLVANGLPTLV